MLTAYNAGHTLGGTIWHIQHGMESIIYAVDWNQARENVIGGAAWFGGHGGSEVIEPLRKPTALVCSSRNGDNAQLSGTKRKRDTSLLDHIRSSASKDGTVLIPSDSSARVLELAYILERAWQQLADDPILQRTRVYLASRSASTTMQHAQSLLEWMDEGVVREFDAEEDTNARDAKNTGNKQVNGTSRKPSKPFELQHIKMIERPQQMERALRKPGPKVILASDASLTWGLSKLALQGVADKVANLIILTDRCMVNSNTQEPSLGQAIWEILQMKEDGVAVENTSEGDQLEQVHTGGKTVVMRHVQKMPLEPGEQQIYQQYMATQRQLQSSLVAGTEIGIDETADIADDSSSSTSSDESDDEHQGRALNASAALGHAGRAKRDLSEKDLGVSILLRKKDVYDFDVRQFKRGRNAIFPYIHQRKRGDEFGEYIKPEDYLRPEEKEEAISSQNGPKFAANLGQKRKWEDIGGGKDAEGLSKAQKTGKGSLKGENRSSQTASQRIEDESSDSSDPEPEKEELDGPGKVSFSSSQIVLNARLAFVDFSGLHDQRSLQNLIELINPRKLILIGGTQQETSALAVDCRSLLVAKDGEDDASTADVFTPSVGETVDASVDTNAWTVKLSRGLVRRLVWQNVHKMGVSALAGELKGELPGGDSIEVLTGKNKKQKLLKQDTQEKNDLQEAGAAAKEPQPLLDLVSASLATTSRSIAQPLYVGDMRLAELRRLLGGVGYSAEFRGEGTLLINGMVAVKKLGTGKIIVEGSPANTSTMTTGRSAGTFYDVRRTIYDGLAIIAGS